MSAPESTTPIGAAISRLAGHGVIVKDAGGAKRPHLVAGQALTNDEVYLLANVLDKMRLTNASRPLLAKGVTV